MSGQVVAVQVERGEVAERGVERGQGRLGALHAGDLEIDEGVTERVALDRGRGRGRGEVGWWSWWLGELGEEGGVVAGIKVQGEGGQVWEHEAFHERGGVRRLDEREDEVLHGRQLDRVRGPVLGVAGRTRRAEGEDVQIGRSLQGAGKDRVGRAHVLGVVREFELLQALQQEVVGARGPVDVDAPERELDQVGRSAAKGGEEGLAEVRRPEAIVLVRIVVVVVVEAEHLELGRLGDGGQRGEDAVHDLIVVHHELEDAPSPRVREDEVSHGGQADGGDSAGKLSRLGLDGCGDVA